MRIAYLTSGAAGMYCGSCMRDNALAAALQQLGHDCVLVPTYTPIRTDEPDVSLPRVFFGGVNIYLEQKSSLFRRMPGWLRRLLDSPGLLRFVSRFGMKTRPEELGDLTLSMLRGLEGNQRRDALELAGWLHDEYRPEVLCLSNILLSGVLPAVKRHGRPPVVCTLQGDDIFLDWLPALHRETAFALIRDNARHVDAYLTTSRYYADFMSGYLDLPRQKMHVVLPGINLTGFDTDVPRADHKTATQDAGRATRNGPIAGAPPLTIGYLARICPEKGLHVLVRAMHHLMRDSSAPPCRLRVAGYLGERDRSYLYELMKEVDGAGWGGRFEYVGEVDHAGKVAFLKGLDLFSVPSTYREPKGLYVLEAWAAGVPVVQPRHGSFPELIEASGGGLLHAPADPADLAERLRELLLDAERRRELGQRGQEAVRARFTARRMAEETAEVLREVIKTDSSSRER